MADDIRALKTYTWHGEQCFFISTIERDSSACVPPPAPRYYETIAWKYDWATQERGEQVAMDGSGDQFDQHFDMCKQLRLSGEWHDTDEDFG